MKRTFIAIKISISERTKELIHILKLELKDEKIRWVDVDYMHITLFFLGDTDENLISKISQKLIVSLAKLESFELICKGVGVFRSVYNPKALWFGIQKSENLDEIKLGVDQVMKSLGFKIENRDFRPHLTIGRSKFIKNKNGLKDLIEKYRSVEIQRFKIREVYLYESQLTPQGPIYKILAEIPLD